MCNFFKSSEISDVFYDLPWYKKDLDDVMKNLPIIIQRTHNRPAKLTCGKFHDVNLEYFILALNTALGYFSVLVNVTN